MYTHHSETATETTVFKHVPRRAYYCYKTMAALSADQRVFLKTFQNIRWQVSSFLAQLDILVDFATVRTQHLCFLGWTPNGWFRVGRFTIVRWWA